MDDLNNKSEKLKRRLRYKGNHPRRFEEKYKELQSERYPLDVDKVIRSGKTPAGTHRPICVKEILEILNPLPGQVGLDATLGFGGHAVELVKRIRPTGRLYAVDVDSIEIVRTKSRLRDKGFTEQELIIKSGNFAGISKLAGSLNGGFDFVLADLGVSSMQLDNPARGFSFKREGPLDLRLNPKRGRTARDLIFDMDAKQLETLLVKNSDEPYARRIARALYRNKTQINTTTQLTETVVSSLIKGSFCVGLDKAYDSVRRVFQALRIEVNQELAVLDQFLRDLPFCLKSQGRAVILSFHSGEDRRVADSFGQGLINRQYSNISQQPIRPTAKEKYSNPRSKSAVLRWAIKR